MKKCIYCNSTQVARFRLDSDWATGAGDFYPVNDDSEYTEEQLTDFHKSWRPDIECLYCLSCSQVFE